jgi:hypothetical protein
VPTEDRYSRWSTRGKMVPLDDVHRLGRYASHHAMDGRFYEYDLGTFWWTDVTQDDPGRRSIEDRADLPPGPWYHLPGCGCEVCGEQPEAGEEA